MATLYTLRHDREEPRSRPPVRLTLMGRTVVMELNGIQQTIQRLPTRQAAQEHIQRMLRLREESGYRPPVQSEIPDDLDLARPPDPLQGLIRHFGRGRMVVDLEDPVVEDDLAAIVARLETSQARGIDLMRNDDAQGAAFVSAFAGKVLPSVEFLLYVALISGSTIESVDHLALLFASLPNVDRALIRGQVALGPLEHAALRKLYLEAQPTLVRRTIIGLGRSKLPSLTTLSLEVSEHADLHHGLDRPVAAALRSLAAPRLEAIEVTGIEDVTRFLDVLTATPLPPSWALLYVKGRIGDEDELLTLLRERAPVLESLPMLALPLADDLSVVGVAEVKARLPRIVDSCDLLELQSPYASDDW